MKFNSTKEYLDKYKIVSKGMGEVIFPFEHTGVKSMVRIRCTKHNTINKIRVETSLNGSNGCKYCIKERRHNRFKNSVNLDKIKENLRQTHKDRYDYTLFSEYNGVDAKIKIICPIHGVFQQSFYQTCNLDKNIVTLQKFRIFNNICLKDTNTEYFQQMTKKINYRGILV